MGTRDRELAVRGMVGALFRVTSAPIPGREGGGTLEVECGRRGMGREWRLLRKGRGGKDRGQSRGRRGCGKAPTYLLSAGLQGLCRRVAAW